MIYRYKKFKNFFKVNEMFKTENATNREALSKMRRSFTMIITNWPFFSELLFNLSIYEAHPLFIPTMATDGISIGYNPLFVNKLKQEEVTFVIIHEIMHNVNLHFARMVNKDLELWNKAGDYAINILIDDMTKSYDSEIIKTPKGILLDKKYENMSAEEIYELLKKEADKNKKKCSKCGGTGKVDKNNKDQQQGDGSGQGEKGQQDQKDQQQGGGSGQGEKETCPHCGGSGHEPQEQQGGGQQGDGQPGGQGGKLDPNDLKKPGEIAKNGKEIYDGNQQGKQEDGDEQSTKDLEKKWKEIVQRAASKNPGTGSAGLDRWIKKLTKPKVKWRTELKKFVNGIYNELDYAYFNKKYISSGLYIPGPKKVDKSMFKHVVIAIDTSGSIGQETLDKFATELSGIFKNYQIEKCTVIWCDADIPQNGIQQFDRIDSSFKLNKLKPVGGGGTSFKPPFKWVYNKLIKRGIMPAFFIYFTDAFGDAPNPSNYGIKNYHKRVMWVITENDDASNIKFGKKLYIDKINP